MRGRLASYVHLLNAYNLPFPFPLPPFPFYIYPFLLPPPPSTERRGRRKVDPAVITGANCAETRDLEGEGGGWRGGDGGGGTRRPQIHRNSIGLYYLGASIRKKEIRHGGRWKRKNRMNGRVWK